MSSGKPQKIAVLGGGVSALTAVFELTSEADWQQRYDITVYQMSWRLGGKGASGRNRQIYDRIQEHGLHIWFGFYDNAFGMLRRCYEENARPLDRPLSRWDEAFKPTNYFVLSERVKDTWYDWKLSFPMNLMVPGESKDPPDVEECIWIALKWLLSLLVSTSNVEFTPAEGGTKFAWFMETHAPFLAKVVEDGLAAAHLITLSVEEQVLHAAVALAADMAAFDGDPVHHRSALLSLLERLITWLRQHMTENLDDNTETRRFHFLAEFTIATIRGIIADGVLDHGFDVINHLDFRDWLKKHGASEQTVTSPLVQGFYCLVFAGTYYTYEAGTALRATIRMLFTYRGSIYWKMQAGMGDVVFAPLYEVLRKRGVKFQFFHRVGNLELNSDKTAVASIQMQRMVTLKNGEYEPLYDVRGLPSWPSEPFYEQLVEGEELKKRNIDLESFWTDWEPIESYQLQQGVDFDRVLLGIPIGALPYICGELIAANSAWKLMVAHVQAIPTIAFQFWMYPDVTGMGQPVAQTEPVMITTFQEPYDTLADMSDLLIRENWPNDLAPNNITYFCGPMPDVTLPPPSDHGFPAQATQRVVQYAQEFLQTGCAFPFPNLLQKDGQFRWENMVDPARGTGPARLNGQFFRANVDPTEHYVLSVTDSWQYRLDPDKSGFSNLVLSGDWTNCLINAGCIEAAAISGLLAAKAISGRSVAIRGHMDGRRKAHKKEVVVVQTVETTVDTLKVDR